MALFKEHSEEQQAHCLAAYLPNGKAWTGKNVNNSKLRSLLIGLGRELLRVEQKMNEIANECDIAQTSALIGEWEKLLGIPDAAIPVADTLEQRRNNVLFKLSMFGASKAEDYERIAAVLGFNITVSPADDGGDIPYSDWRKRFVMVVTLDTTAATWPLTWPVLWGGVDFSVLIALFEAIKPAVCYIVYRGA